MTPNQVAEQIKTRLQELGSIDAKVWSQIDVDLYTTINTHAKAGLHCADRSVAALIQTDPKLGEILVNAESEDINALPHGEHTLLIFH